MGHKRTARVLRHLHLKETWIIFFMLGIIMMNFPFLHIFYVSHQLFGLPALFFYLYAGWAISIGVIYLFVKAIDIPNDDKGEQR